MNDARYWMDQGTQLFLDTVDRLGDVDMAAPSVLPGWSRSHLLAHVSANADALHNLVCWARTGVETPMYTSPDSRDRAIENGSQLASDTLIAWSKSSAEKLHTAMELLSETQWDNLIVTAQGRTVTAAEIPWMRAREVYVHVVDLGSAVTFADLPVEFLITLGNDIAHKRAATTAHPALHIRATDISATWDISGTNAPITVSGPVAELLAYLSGRPHTLLTTDGSLAPALPSWL